MKTKPPINTLEINCQDMKVPVGAFVVGRPSIYSILQDVRVWGDGSVAVIVADAVRVLLLSLPLSLPPCLV